MAYPEGYSVAGMQKYFYENLVDPVTNTLKTSAVISLASNNVELVDSSGNALIGPKVKAACLPVTLSTNESPVPVTGTITAVTSITNTVKAKSPRITWTAFGKTLGSANAEPLIADQACDILVVSARSTNAGIMCIGPATLTADKGAECLAASPPLLTFTGLVNANEIYAIGTSGDKCGGYYGVIS